MLSLQPEAANLRGNGGACPLHMSGMSHTGQRRQMVQLLAEAGAELDAELEAGAELYAPDEWGYTALMRCTSNNLLEGALWGGGRCVLSCVVCWPCSLV